MTAVSDNDKRIGTISSIGFKLALMPFMNTHM